MKKPIQLVIQGASGRNGKRLVALGSVDPEVQLVGAMVRATSPVIGQDAGTVAGIAPIGLPLRSEWPQELDVVIDFSSPEGCMEALDECIRRRSPIVIATTGLSADQIQRIHAASATIPICLAPNTSAAVNIGMKLVERAARALKHVPGGADVEIIERHHRFKEDSPSGTAIQLGRIIADAMGIDQHVHGRHGIVGKRPYGEIGYHAVRVGDDVGQHTVVFGMMGETIEIRVAASNRDCYATGAIAAAKYLIGKPAQLHTMANVLGIE